MPLRVYVTQIPDLVWTRKEVLEPEMPLIVTMTSDAALDAYTAVYESSDDHVSLAAPPSVDALAPIGVLLDAASGPGDLVRVAYGGRVTNPAWALTAGEVVLLGINGLVVQTQPIGIVDQVVLGLAVSATAIVVRIALPVQLIT